MNNEFLIGLGGIGGRSLQAFRRLLAECASDTFESYEASGVKTEYLYIDSSDDILRSHGWKVHGKNIRLSTEDVVLLEDEHRPISELSQWRHIVPWVGNLAEHFAALSGCPLQEAENMYLRIQGAGGLRRYGRVLFASHAQEIRNKVRQKAHHLRTGRLEYIHFRIFCSLAGGTGSGCLMDTITLIRSLAQEEQFPAYISVYSFIGGIAPADSAPDCFYANQYATLRDLNALMCGRYQPYNVAGSDGGNCYVHSEPVRLAYLTAVNELGEGDLSSKIESVASSCLDSILWFASSSYIGRSALLGMNWCDMYPGEPKGECPPARSYRFAAVESRYWNTPTAQMAELHELDCKKRVLQRWLEGSPYFPAEKKRDFSPALQKMPHILSFGSVDDALQMKFRDVISPLTAALSNMSQERRKTPHWPERLLQISDEIVRSIENMTRDEAALAAFESSCRKDAEEVVHHAAAVIDHMSVWCPERATTWGMKDAEDFLRAYEQYVADQMAKLCADEHGISDTDVHLVNNMQAREAEGAALGFLARRLTKRYERLIQGQGRDAEKRVEKAYSAFVRLVAEKLQEHLSHKLGMLRERVHAARTALHKMLQETQTKSRALEHYLDEHTQVGYGSLYELNVAELNRERILMDEQTRSMDAAMAETYTPAWHDCIGSVEAYTETKLRHLCERMDNELIPETTKKIRRFVYEKYWNTPSPDSTFFDCLTRVAGPDPEHWEERLGSRVEQFVSAVLNTIPLDTHVPEPSMPHRSPAGIVHIGIPGYCMLSSWLKKRAQQAARHARLLPAECVCTYSLGKNDGIRVMDMPYWFPARFVPVVSRLHEHYRLTAEMEGGEHVLYFANIDDAGIPLESPERPSLLA